MAYTTIKKPSDYFNTNLYTGNNTETSHTVGFQPDFTWLKVRNAVGSHYLFDSVRLATKYLQANSNTAEGTDATTLKSFDANGYTVGTSNAVNTNNETMVGWSWNANGAGSANTDGDIASTVSVNTTSGFSIVKWTSTGSTGTVGHGLGVTPKFIVVKRLEDSGYDWVVYHVNDTAGLYLNSAAVNNDSSAATIFDRSPTNTVFNITADGRIGGNTTGKNYIAYCFADVQGYSKFGSYTGNGNADGPFIYTGFKPAFLIVKNIDAGEAWGMHDNKRPGLGNGNAPVGHFELQPNLSNAENSSGAAGQIDFLSNGFKLRTATNSLNVAQNYIYMAFASEPLVGDNPATAR